MNAYTQASRDYSFVVGLVAGTVVGAGLMMWLAPQTGAELRQRATDSARSLGRRASGRYQQVSTRAAEAVDDLISRGEDVRDGVAEAVAQGAREVERYAVAAKSTR